MGTRHERAVCRVANGKFGDGDCCRSGVGGENLDDSLLRASLGRYCECSCSVCSARLVCSSPLQDHDAEVWGVRRRAAYRVASVVIGSLL